MNDISSMRIIMSSRERKRERNRRERKITKREKDMKKERKELRDENLQIRLRISASRMKHRH